MAIPSDVAAVVSSRDPGIAVLIKFDFLSATRRVWTGFGRLNTLDGFAWDGLGDLVSISGLAGGLSGAASTGTLGISGVSADLLPVAIGERDEFMQRPVALFLQAFQNRVLVGNPCPLSLRIMTAMDITRDAGTRSISISHESPYIGRNNPAFGTYSDRDQQSRFPGDRFCERVPFLLFKQEKWPSY
jgi:hypothetical protein